ncbi:MAG: hypothetical protein AB7G75_16975 [Candidatus Binatia bacterium]
MRQLRINDLLLLSIVVSLWLACFALQVREVAYGRLAWVPVFVSIPENAQSYPAFVGFWPGSGREASDLIAGDQLIRLGQTDLRGVGPINFLALAYKEAQSSLQVSLSFMHEGQSYNTIIHLTPFVSPWGTVLLTLSFAVAAILVFLRMPRSRTARATFLASMTYSIHWCLFMGGPHLGQTYAWVGVYILSSFFLFPLILRAALVLPEEVAPTARWMFFWPWIFSLRGVTAFSWYFGVPFSHRLGLYSTHLLEATYALALLGILTRNFFQAGPLGRRQLKWVLYGFYIGGMPTLAAATLALFEPRLWWLREASVGMVVFIPLCVFIAIVRFKFFDIDRLISSTAAYTILLGLLATSGLLLAPGLTHAASQIFGLSPGSGQVVFTSVFALFVIPGHGYLRPQIERIFFAERYALERGVADLLQTLPECTDQHELLAHMGERLHNLLRPESCVIYEQSGTTYPPLFVKGSIVPPVFDGRSGLWGAVQTRNAYADEEEWRRSARVVLRPSERAVLDRLRIGFVVPLGQTKPPPFFLVLGPKQSGDVYTATDATLLKNVAKTVSAQLERGAVRRSSRL